MTQPSINSSEKNHSTYQKKFCNLSKEILERKKGKLYNLFTKKSRNLSKKKDFLVMSPLKKIMYPLKENSPIS